MKFKFHSAPKTKTKFIFKETPISLTHITDCGVPSGDGLDTTTRIIQQYQRCGVPCPLVISPGTGAIRVAFTALTHLGQRSQDITQETRTRFGGKNYGNLPIALNSAPRNSDEKKEKSTEDPIYLVETQGEENPDYVVYGKEVVRWVRFFLGKTLKAISEVKSIPGIIEDTTNGTQFRSATYLPIAQLAHYDGELKNNAHKIQNVEEIFPSILLSENGGIVLPPDEFSNSRLLVSNETFPEILKQKTVSLEGLPLNLGKLELQLAHTLYELPVAESITKIGQDHIGLWPSSNELPNSDLSVLNVGKQWQKGEEKQTDPLVLHLAKIFSKSVGEILTLR